MRLFLLLHDASGTMVAREKIVLDRLPQVGTALRPPVCTIACLVTGAFPANLEDTGDIRFGGTVYADVLTGREAQPRARRRGRQPA
jgi:hypothetical protein